MGSGNVIVFKKGANRRVTGSLMGTVKKSASSSSSGDGSTSDVGRTLASILCN